MAMFRLEAKVIARGQRAGGRSVVAAAAYRAGAYLKDIRYDRQCDYRRRQAGVVYNRILAPDGAPEWAKNPEKLWNEVERSETRSDAQLAREFILAVPPELSDAEQIELLTGWANDELVKRGMAVQVSLHHSRDGNNPHGHLLCTLRRFDGGKLSDKKAREWNDKSLLIGLRESWAEYVNAALEDAGSLEKVDHRSLQAQGVDRIPEPKIGVAATAMRRRGMTEEPERVREAEEVRLQNFMRPVIQSVEETGETPLNGMGETEWERHWEMAHHLRQAPTEAPPGYWKNHVQHEGRGAAFSR